MEVAGQKMMYDLRMRPFPISKAFGLFFDKNPVGRLVTRLTNDIENIHEMFTSIIINLFNDILLLVGIILILLHFRKKGL
jgi:ABC-type multidrug transport system fused ATPase/permease subunit